MTHPPRVLIIDDNEADVFICKRMLSRETGIDRDEILTARDGEQALEILRECAATHSIPSLILLDINMPRMTGFEFLEAWRQEVGNGEMSVRVVFLTSSTDGRDRERAGRFGVQDYLVKPPTRDAIRALHSSATAG